MSKKPPDDNRFDLGPTDGAPEEPGETFSFVEGYAKVASISFEGGDKKLYTVTNLALVNEAGQLFTPVIQLSGINIEEALLKPFEYSTETCMQLPTENIPSEIKLRGTFKPGDISPSFLALIQKARDDYDFCLLMGIPTPWCQSQIDCGEITFEEWQTQRLAEEENNRSISEAFQKPEDPS